MSMEIWWGFVVRKTSGASVKTCILLNIWSRELVLKRMKMAPYSSSDVIPNLQKPRDPKLIRKDIACILDLGQTCALTLIA